MKADNRGGWLRTLHHAVARPRRVGDASKRGITWELKIKGPQKRPAELSLKRLFVVQKGGDEITSDEQVLFRRKIIMLQ
ncbi:hypothetical protein DC522_10485 [Microvirga sp. KLBC 81]|nr:hypothetical protein DC522_10485 [Microvirga sp. KLBC 81]